MRIAITTALAALMLTAGPAPAQAGGRGDAVDLVCWVVQDLACGTYYRDADGDGYGDPATEHHTPLRPSGEVTRGGDCDDKDPKVHPGTIETYDGRDEDCDGAADEVALVVSEMMINPEAVADTSGEWVEVTNASPEPVQLTGVSLTVGTRVCDVAGLGVLGPARRFVVARVADPSVNGGAQADLTCAISLVNTGTTVSVGTTAILVDRVDYSGWAVPSGAAVSLDPGAHDPSANDASAAWCAAASAMASGDRGTPRAANDPCGS